MNRILIPAAALTCLVALPAAASPEFNVDVEPAGDNRSRVWLSYLADSNVTALDFTVRLDAPDTIRADASACLASLPKSHTGLCRVQGNLLRGVIYSPNNTPLPDTNLGSVVVDPDSLLKGADGKTAHLDINAVEVNTVNPRGITVRADVRVSGQLAQSSKPGKGGN